MRFLPPRWSAAVVGACCSLVAFGLMPSPAAASPTEPAPTTDIRVATYNTCGHGCLPTVEECEATIGRDCGTKLPSWSDERAAAVVDDVVDSDLDVVATQEIGNNATPTQPGVDVESFRVPLTEAMEEQGYAEAPADYEGTRHPHLDYPLKSGAGRFTYYDAERFSHLDEDGEELPHDLLWLPDSTDIYGKTMTWNTLREQDTGALFVVVNMHLEFRNGDATDPNGWTRDWDVVRFNDAWRTASHVSTGNPDTRGLPVVFAGDMNSALRDPGASPYAAFENLGFRDAFELAPEENRSGEQWASYNGGNIPIPEGDNIDYVFVDEDTTVLDWAVVPQTEAEDGEAWDLLRSDHNLLYSTLRLQVTHG